MKKNFLSEQSLRIFNLYLRKCKVSKIMTVVDWLFITQKYRVSRHATSDQLTQRKTVIMMLSVTYQIRQLVNESVIRVAVEYKLFRNRLCGRGNRPSQTISDKGIKLSEAISMKLLDIVLNNQNTKFLFKKWVV